MAKMPTRTFPKPSPRLLQSLNNETPTKKKKDEPWVDSNVIATTVTITTTKDNNNNKCGIVAPISVGQMKKKKDEICYPMNVGDRNGERWNAI